MHMQINAHKAIDDIQTTDRLYLQNGGKKTVIKYIVDIIRASTKFYMGCPTQLNALTKNLKPDGDFLPFLDDDEYTYFPYRLNYFEYYLNLNENKKFPPGHERHPWILIVDYNREEKVLHAFKIDLHFKGFDDRPTYWIYPIGYRIRMGENFPGIDRHVEFMQVWKPPDDGGLKVLLEDRYFIDTTKFTILTLYNTVKFLNTNGVESKLNYPDKKSQKKRQKKGKEPFFTYHTLVLNPQASRSKYPGKKPQGLWKNPLHSVREYVKEYTEEAPLFGRVVGKIKVAPFLRGDYRIGVKIKDYEIRKEKP